MGLLLTAVPPEIAEAVLLLANGRRPLSGVALSTVFALIEMVAQAGAHGVASCLFQLKT